MTVMVMVKYVLKGGPKSYTGLKETEIPAGAPLTVAEGISASNKLPVIVGIRVE